MLEGVVVIIEVFISIIQASLDSGAQLRAEEEYIG